MDAAHNFPYYAELNAAHPQARIAFARFALLVKANDLCGMNINHPIGDYWVLLCKLPAGHDGEHGFHKAFYAALGFAGVDFNPPKRRLQAVPDPIGIGLI